MKFAITEGRQPFHGSTSQTDSIPLNCHSCQHIFSSIKQEEAVRLNSHTNCRKKISNLGFMFITICLYCIPVFVSQNAWYFQIFLETNNFDVKNLLLIWYSAYYVWRCMKMNFHRNALYYKCCCRLQISMANTKSNLLCFKPFW